MEEAISPIPSFIVLIPAGATALAQGLGWWYLPVLGLISSVGRILAAVLLYLLADKGEDLLFGKGRRFFGITHKQLEDFGAKFGRERRGWWGLFALNAIPVLPTSFLSLACGFVKIDFKTFVTASFLGSAVNAVLYLSAGYYGLAAVSQLEGLNVFLQVLAALVMVVVVVWLVAYQKMRSKKSGK